MYRKSLFPCIFHILFLPDVILPSGLIWNKKRKGKDFCGKADFYLWGIIYKYFSIKPYSAFDDTVDWGTLQHTGAKHVYTTTVP